MSAARKLRACTEAAIETMVTRAKATVMRAFGNRIRFRVLLCVRSGPQPRKFADMGRIRRLHLLDEQTLGKCVLSHVSRGEGCENHLRVAVDAALLAGKSRRHIHLGLGALLDNSQCSVAEPAAIAQDAQSAGGEPAAIGRIQES